MMRPHDDEMIVWWHDYMRLFVAYSSFEIEIHGCMTDSSMDWQIDGLTDRWNGIDARARYFVPFNLGFLGFFGAFVDA